eukprot:4048925-Amphidinium_carterae.1
MLIHVYKEWQALITLTLQKGCASAILFPFAVRAFGTPSNSSSHDTTQIQGNMHCSEIRAEMHGTCIWDC